MPYVHISGDEQEIKYEEKIEMGDDPNSPLDIDGDGHIDAYAQIPYKVQGPPIPTTANVYFDEEYNDSEYSYPEGYDNVGRLIGSYVDGDYEPWFNRGSQSITSTEDTTLEVTLYYESRFIWQNYGIKLDNNSYTKIPGYKINQNYRVKVAGNYLDQLNHSDSAYDATGFVSFKDAYACTANNEIYTHAVNDEFWDYSKYNYLNTNMYGRAWSLKDETSFNATNEETFAENLQNFQTVGIVDKHSLWNTEHADAYRIDYNYEYEPPIKIKVYHIVDGKRDDEIANDNEIATVNQWNNQEIEAPNGYSERKSVYEGKIELSDDPLDASEYYEIDEDDTLTVNRSSTILKNGYYYKCTKVDVDGYTCGNLKVEIANADPGDIITVNYYYEKVPYSVVDDPSDDGGRNQLPGNKDNGIEISKLKFTAVSSESGSYDSYLNSSNFSQSGNISYVPAKENLRAYLEASIVKAKNLKYHIGVNGYDVETYTAYGIDNTYEVGSVNGFTGGARENIYNTGTSTPIYSAKQSEIENTVYKTKDEVMDKDTGGVFNGSPSSTDSNITGKLNTITSKYVTDKEYFKTDKAQYVESNKYNGLRNPNGAIYYKEYNVMNHEKYGTSYTKKVSDADTMDVDIYTPFEVGNITIKSSNDVVDHSKETTENGLAVIQQNADFTLTVRSNEDGACYQDLYTRVGGSGYNPLYKYLQYYYVKLDFDVKITSGSYRVWSVNGSSENATVGIARNANPGDVVEKGSIIRLVPNSGVGVLYANAYSTSENTSKVNYNKYKAYASTVNVVSEDYTVDQIAKSSYTASDTGTGTPYIDNKQIALHSDDRSYQNISELKRDAFYIVSSLKKTISLGRIFDFEITDCTDVNFKNVFRKSTNADGSYTVNDLTGIAYYSGFNRLRLRDEWAGYNINYYTNRDNNSAITYGYVKTVVPLGPYKNTSNEYISAPKLGYRFSFDIKTSGYFDPLDKDKYSTDRKVEISPSYYYISKDGAQVKNNIKLYYKNASGKYVAFENSGYTISYKPNDGYRTLLTDDTTPVKDNYLTTNLKTLDISKTFTLTGKDMITMSDHGFIQSWYGEFKLPNSTIAVEVDDSGSVIDINNPLKDGYIAVKFDMRCIDTYTDTNGSKQTVTIEYNRKNANDSRENTTQWDYEGYLGFDVNKQNLQDLKLQLEKGTYTVGTQDRYNQIKGTVAFFDIDSRAADDFE